MTNGGWTTQALVWLEWVSFTAGQRDPAARSHLRAVIRTRSRSGRRSRLRDGESCSIASLRGARTVLVSPGPNGGSGASGQPLQKRKDGALTACKGREIKSPDRPSKKMLPLHAGHFLG